MMTASIALAASAAVLLHGAGAAGEDLMAGKVDTGRAISLEATVDAPASTASSKILMSMRLEQP